ncbi:MAG: hypothetical protein HY763_16120 [Planctomycetes bacterium]|nr:hypothetical protein [Planctomycetota bacterium]
MDVAPFNPEARSSRPPPARFPLTPAAELSRAASASRAERLLARLALAGVSAVVALSVLDRISPWFLGAARLPIEETYPEGIFRSPQPYTMFGGRPEPPLNALGFPGAPPEHPKDPSEFRIFILGGSTVFEGNPTIPQLVEEALHANGAAPARVYNCGVIASVSAQELARIVFQLADYQPDLIVMYNGGNDTLEPLDYDPRPGYPYNYFLYERNPILAGDDGEYPLLPLVTYSSNLCRRFGTWRFAEVFGNLNACRRNAGWRTPAWESEIARVYVRNLRRANAVSRGFGADFLAFFQPTLAYKEPLAGAEAERAARSAVHLSLSRNVRAMVLEDVQRGAEREALPFVDLSDIYDGVEHQVFRDFIHTLQPAKPRVARAIADHIRARFLSHHVSQAAGPR